MKFAVELVALRQIDVQLGGFVEISVSTGDTIIPRAFGQDEYHLSTIIPAGNRFAATGRKYICQLDLPGMGLGPMEATPAVKVPIQEDDVDLTITIRTNLIFELGELSEYVKVKFITDGTILDVRFTSPKPGMFVGEIKITPV